MTQKRYGPLDLRHPFFLPVWRRRAVVILLGIWAILETIGGNMFWAVLAGGIGLYTFYVFFFNFDGPDDGPPKR